MSNKHEFYKGLNYLHIRVAAKDNGACLSKHESVYKEHNSCSYRWQGLAKAREKAEIYNISEKPSWHIGQRSNCAFAEDTIKNMSSSVYEIFRATNGNTVSFLSKKKQLRMQVIVADNFTNGQVPYTNDVHHVLPDGLLRNEIDNVAETLKSRSGVMRYLITAGLLKEKYNVNYKDNMIILPHSRRVAKLIGLPTHKGSHPKYDTNIQNSIQKALENYKKIAEQIENGEPHDKVNPKQLKEKLLKISNNLHDALIAYGQSHIKDRSSLKVNKLPDSVFQGLL